MPSRLSRFASQERVTGDQQSQGDQSDADRRAFVAEPPAQARDERSGDDRAAYQ